MYGLSVERGKYIPAAVPIDITGAGLDGDWVSMKHFRNLAIILMKGAWAGGTSAITLEQAKDAAGTDAKALAFAKQYDGTALTDDILAENTVSSNTFNLSTAANKFHVIEVLSQDLDSENGFTYVRVRAARPGSNADLLSALYHLYNGDYLAKPETLPTAIA